MTHREEMAVNVLLESIKSSSQYRELQSARTELGKYPELVEHLRAFEKRNQEAMGGNYEPQTMQKILAELNDTYNKLMQFPAMARYFKAREAVGEVANGLMQSLNQKIMDIMP